MPMPLAAILTLLLIATPSINSAHSSLQQEYLIQSVANILVQDNFTATIFFQYGAESVVLQPPWDEVKGDGVAEISATYARTGTRSVYFYQKAPPKTDQERRIFLRYFGSTHQKSEGYLSWWVYFPDQALADSDTLNTGSNFWGPNLGGWQLWFGPESNKFKYWEGGRFVISASKNIRFQYRWHGSPEYHPDATALNAELDTGFDVADFVNKWVHLQVHWKIHTTDGAVQAWFNNTLVMNKTGIATDPRAYSSWNSNPVDGGQTYFAGRSPNGYPVAEVSLYQGTNSFENWIWVDDVVMATEKVPENYVFSE